MRPSPAANPSTRWSSVFASALRGRGKPNGAHTMIGCIRFHQHAEKALADAGLASHQGDTGGCRRQLIFDVREDLPLACEQAGKARIRCVAKWQLAQPEGL